MSTDEKANVDGETIRVGEEPSGGDASAGVDVKETGSPDDAETSKTVEGDANLSSRGEPSVAESDGAHTEAPDAEPGDAEPGDAEPGDTESGDAESGDAEPGDTESAAAETGDAEPGDTEADDADAEDAEAGDTHTPDTGIDAADQTADAPLTEGDSMPVESPAADQAYAGAPDFPAPPAATDDRDARHPFSIEFRVPGEGDMRALGRQLAPSLEPGDLLVLSGKLGAGKTTFVQGIGEGLDVDRPVTSPTFVIARVHSSGSGRVPLMHVDAYRLDDIAEVDDLDLETPAEHAVTVVEWGEGMVEDLADDRLEVVIEHREGDERLVRLTGVGRRWDRLFKAAST